MNRRQAAPPPAVIPDYAGIQGLGHRAHSVQFANPPWIQMCS